MEGFTVRLNNSLTTTTVTDGLYEFTNIPINATYEISASPAENSNVLSGLTAFDLVIMIKHILGVEAFDNPYQSIAADANNDGRVSTFDVVEFRKLILGINLELPNNESWRFLDLEEINTTTVTDPFALSESIILPDLNSDASNINFVGVKVGDVSSLNGLQASESRSRASLAFKTADIFMKAGQTVEIPISAENFDQIVGYQFTMNLDGLVFADVKPGVLDVSQNNFAQLDDQTITTLWFNEQAISSNEILFTLVVKALYDTQLSKALDFNASAIPAIGYEASANSMEVDLSFQAIEGISELNNTQLLQNEPNPFVNETSIGFNLVNNGIVNLRVFDATGRVIFNQTGEYNKGSHQIILRDLENFATGVLYYQLSTADFQATKKMIRQ